MTTVKNTSEIECDDDSRAQEVNFIFIIPFHFAYFLLTKVKCTLLMLQLALHVVSAHLCANLPKKNPTGVRTRDMTFKVPGDDSFNIGDLTYVLIDSRV